MVDESFLSALLLYLSLLIEEIGLQLLLKRELLRIHPIVSSREQRCKEERGDVY